jgi:hypothetical protein
MLHENDTHYWIGRTPGGWISQEDLATTADPKFSEVDILRIEPLSPTAFQAILEAAKPPGYTLFFRHRFHEIMGGQIIGVEYILALERGKWTAKDAAAIDIDDFPIVDGFRAKLDLTGEVDFESSANFTFITSLENGINKYAFVRS